MRFARKPIALGLLVATIQLAGAAYAQAPKASAAPVEPPAPAATKTPIPTAAAGANPESCQSWACLDARSAGLKMNDSDIDQPRESLPVRQ
jgi:hypothetical protein